MSKFTDGEPTLPFGGDVDIDAAIAAACRAGDATAIAKLMEVRDARPAGWRGESHADTSQCCQICFDELGAKPAVQFPCAHWMCRVCAHTYSHIRTFSGCAFCPGDTSVTLRDLRMLLRETPTSSYGPPAPRARSSRRASWHHGSRNTELFTPEMCDQAALERALVESAQTPQPTIASPPAPSPELGPAAQLSQQDWGGDPPPVQRKLAREATVRSPTGVRSPLRSIVAQARQAAAAVAAATSKVQADVEGHEDDDHGVRRHRRTSCKCLGWP
jgi:hypothetical protein